MKATLTVTVTLPHEASRQEVQAYVLDAVASMKGCLHPDDPLFDLANVRVKNNRTGEVMEWKR